MMYTERYGSIPLNPLPLCVFGRLVATQTEGTQDIPTVSSVDNKVYQSKAGHLIEIDNSEGSERISIKHKTGSKIVFNSDGTVSIIASNIKLNA